MATSTPPRRAPAGSLTERFADVRALTERLAAPLSAEDQTVQSMPDVSPTKWHRAHTTWFFETFVLEPHVAGYEAVDPAFGYLFNSYYEAVGPRHPRPHRGLLTRPGASEVAAYRAVVDSRMRAALGDGALTDPVLDLVELGLHHEQQHQELLLMDVKHVLWSNPLGPAYRDDLRTGPSPARACSGLDRAAAFEHGGGVVEIGHDGPGFSFDNERPRHRQLLEPYAIARHLVTAGDWLRFVEDGGYRRPELWLSDGWAAVNENGWGGPLYWRRGDAGWEVFTLGGWRPLRDAEPVCHVSYFEADAFARWAGARLPTEAEWEVCAAGTPFDGALDPDVLHPQPSQGEPQWFGQVWQWTASAYLPYAGFREEAGAVGEYNGKFMVNQHVLRGGSCVTPAGNTRITTRNFFPPPARWPFTGVRLAWSRG